MISAIRSSLSGTMLSRISFLKVFGSITSAVPSQLFPTTSTSWVVAAGALAVSARKRATAATRATASLVAMRRRSYPGVGAFRADSGARVGVAALDPGAQLREAVAQRQVFDQDPVEGLVVVRVA